MGGRRRAACIAGLAAAMAAAACRHGPPSYFPTEPGWHYGYRLRLESEGAAGFETLKSFSVNLPRRVLGDITVTPRLFQDGRILYYADDGASVRTAAYQEPGGEITDVAADQYLLKYPLDATTHWREAGRTVLLTQRFLYSKALPVTIGIDLDYKVEAVGETVTVAAGRFSNCVRIAAGGHTTVTTADHQTTLQVSVDLTEWYAPGVGLVKSVRAERAGEERAGNSRLSSELEYLGKPSWFD